MQPDDYIILFEEPRATNNSYKESKIVSNENRKERRKAAPVSWSQFPVYILLCGTAHNRHFVQRLPAIYLL